MGFCEEQKVVGDQINNLELSHPCLLTTTDKNHGVLKWRRDVYGVNSQDVTPSCVKITP